MIEVLACSICGKPGADSAHHKHGIICEECRKKQIPVCDFCSSPGIEWTYPCETFTHAMPGIPNSNWVTNWACCDECHEIIEDERWVDLAKHSVETQLASVGENPPAHIKERLMEMVIDLHKDFRKNRKGPPHKYVPGDEI